MKWIQGNFSLLVVGSWLTSFAHAQSIKSWNRRSVDELSERHEPPENQTNIWLSLKLSKGIWKRRYDKGPTPHPSPLLPLTTPLSSTLWPNSPPSGHWGQEVEEGKIAKMAGMFRVQSVVFKFTATAVDPHCRNTALTSNPPLTVCQHLDWLVGWKRKHFVLFREESGSRRVHSGLADPNQVQNISRRLEGKRLNYILMNHQRANSWYYYRKQFLASELHIKETISKCFVQWISHW